MCRSPAPAPDIDIDIDIDNDTDTDTDHPKNTKSSSRHHAPAGEVGGYFPGRSTLPGPCAPMSAYLNVAREPHTSDERDEKQ